MSSLFAKLFRRILIEIKTKPQKNHKLTQSERQEMLIELFILGVKRKTDQLTHN